MRNMTALGACWAVFMLLAAIPGAVLAQTDRELYGSPASGLMRSAQVAPAAVAVRSSPFEPQSASDTVFVSDTGRYLDTGCTFRSGGPLQIQIDVGRVLGDVARLKAAGVLKGTARIRLPAYDVDVNGVPSSPSIPAEVDRVSFNGHVLSPPTLTGDNGIWKLNSWTIPVEWISFPADPGPSGVATPASNTLLVEIDTASINVQNWCTAVDWVELGIEMAASPVVFLHGFNSNGATWDGSAWLSGLNALGLPNSGTSVDLGGGGSFESRLPVVDEALRSYEARWGVKKLSLVGHSRGGLDARNYMSSDYYHDDVAALVQIDSPNLGSPAADQLPFGAIAELTVGNMALFNSTHPLPSGVGMVSIAAQHQQRSGQPVPSNCDLPLSLTAPYLNDLQQPNDGVVSVLSAQGYSGAVKPTALVTVGADKNACHTAIHKSAAAYQLGRPYVLDPQGGAVAQLAMARATQRDTNKTLLAAGAADLPLQFGLDRQRQTVPASRSGELQVLLPGGAATNILVSGESAALESVSFINPLGRTVTSGAGAALTVDPLGGGQGEVLLSLDATRALRGQWTVRYTVRSGAQAAAAVLAVASSPGMQLSGTLQQWPSVVVAGTSLPVSLKIVDAATGTQPLATASVQVSGLDKPVRLQESPAGSGIYTGTVQASQPGRYALLFTAETAGARYATSLDIDVVASGWAIAAPLSEQAVVDASGQIVRLDIPVPVTTAEAGDFRLQGVLLSASGKRVEGRSPIRALEAGTANLTASFDAAALYATGEPGPYRLTRLELIRYRQHSPQSLAQSAPTYITAAYALRQLKHAPIQLDGARRTTSQPVDTNGDGRYDRIVLHVPVLLDREGYHEWSGSLYDSQGLEYAFASASGELGADAAELTLDFDARQIGARALDPPYLVGDLLIQGASGSLILRTEAQIDAPVVSAFETFVPCQIETSGMVQFPLSRANEPPDPKPWALHNVLDTRCVLTQVNAVKAAKTKYKIIAPGGGFPMVLEPSATAYVWLVLDAPVAGAYLTELQVDATGQQNAIAGDQVRAVVLPRPLF